MLDRLKRKIVSRLLDEVDVFYFDKKNQIDHKIAKLTYKDREVIVDKQNSLTLWYKKNDKYVWNRQESGFSNKEQAIEEAKNFIKDNEMWL